MYHSCSCPLERLSSRISTLSMLPLTALRKQETIARNT